MLRESEAGALSAWVAFMRTSLGLMVGLISVLGVACSAAGGGDETASSTTQALLRNTGRVLLDPSPVAEGSFKACLLANMNNGVSPQQALAICNYRDPKWEGAAASHGSIDAKTAFGRDQALIGAMTCGNAGADPQLSEAPDWAKGPSYYDSPAWPMYIWKENYEQLQKLIQAYKVAWNVFGDAESKAAIATKAAHDDPGNAKKQAEAKQAAAELQTASDAAREAERALQKWRPTVAKAGDFPEPAGGTAVASTMPGYVTACQEASLFIAECNANGWRSFECQQLLDKMKGCADKTIAYPSDDGTCGLEAVDPNTVKHVVAVACESRVHPMPGVDPCTPIAVDGISQSYFWDAAARRGCFEGNPKAMVDPEGPGCGGTFTITTFGEADIDAIVSLGQTKFGGPIFIIPVGPPPNPRAGVDPR